MIHLLERSTRQYAFIWSDILQPPWKSKLEVIWHQTTSNLLLYNLQLTYKCDGLHGQYGPHGRHGFHGHDYICNHGRIIVIMVFMVIMVIRTDRKPGQPGQRGQAGQTGQTDLIFKLDFPGNLCRTSFANFAMFYTGFGMDYSLKLGRESAAQKLIVCRHNRG